MRGLRQLWRHQVQPSFSSESSGRSENKPRKASIPTPSSFRAPNSNASKARLKSWPKKNRNSPRKCSTNKSNNSEALPKLARSAWSRWTKRGPAKSRQTSSRSPRTERMPDCCKMRRTCSTNRKTKSKRWTKCVSTRSASQFETNSSTNRSVSKASTGTKNADSTWWWRSSVSRISSTKTNSKGSAKTLSSRARSSSSTRSKSESSNTSANRKWGNEKSSSFSSRSSSSDAKRPTNSRKSMRRPSAWWSRSKRPTARPSKPRTSADKKKEISSSRLSSTTASRQCAKRKSKPRRRPPEKRRSARCSVWETCRSGRKIGRPKSTHSERNERLKRARDKQEIKRNRSKKRESKFKKTWRLQDKLNLKKKSVD